jgi:hypothetical protein
LLNTLLLSSDPFQKLRGGWFYEEIVCASAVRRAGFIWLKGKASDIIWPMPQPEPDPFHIGEDTIHDIQTMLFESPRKVDQQIATFLKGYQSVSLAELGMAAVNAGVLQAVETKHLAFMTARSWGLEFIKSILRELREIICSPKKDQGKLSAPTQSVLAAIVAFLMHKFGLQSATAYGFALLILSTIGSATKKAFCNMSDHEVLEALRQDK